MSTITLPVLYQVETFGSAMRHGASGGDPQDRNRSQPGPREGVHKALPRHGALRSADFWFSSWSAAIPDIRTVLGRQDIAGQRERAYGTTVAQRPSANRHPVPATLVARLSRQRAGVPPRSKSPERARSRPDSSTTRLDYSAAALGRQNLTAAIHPGLQVDMMRAAQLTCVLSST